MRIRRFVAVAALSLATFLGAQSARADVLEQVPGDSLLVLKVGSLEGLNRKIARFSKDAGFDQLQPDLADLLTLLADKAKVSKGLDRNGDFAMAFLNPAKFKGEEGGEPKSLVVLVPVADYKAFLTNFKSAADEGAGISKVQPQDAPEAVFVSSWGKYAAISPLKAVLAAKPTGLKLTGVSAKESSTKDVLFYTNIKELRPMVGPELKKLRERALGADKQVGGDEGEIAKALGDNKKFTPLAKAAVGQLFNVADAFINEAHSATISLSLNDAGITASVAADFEPTSYIGKLALASKGSDKSLLNGLPDKKYFAFGGAVAESQISKQLASDLLDPIIKELAALNETKNFAKALESSKKAYAATNGYSLGWVAPNPGVPLGQESVIQQITVLHGNAADIREGQKATMEAMNDLMALIPNQPNQSIKFEYKADAKEVAGTKFDTFRTIINYPEDDPQALQAKQMMSFVYGPNGQSGVLGIVNDKVLVGVQGGSDELIADAVAAAKANADTLGNAAGIKAVAAELPKVRSLAFYVDLGTIVNTSLRYAKGLGAQVNVQVPANLPPIGMTAGSDGTAFRADVHIPSKLVQGMMETYAKAMQQMRDPNGGL